MNIALVYDWVTSSHGGAEKTLLALHQAFPRAPLFTAVYSPQDAEWAQVFDVTPSWLNRLPLLRRHHRWLAPFLPLAFESFDFSAFDVVISVTSSEAKGILTKADQLHISYILTPPRYLYGQAEQYLQAHQPVWGTRLLMKPFLRYLKWWDQAAAHRPDVLIAISQLVAQRCQTAYDRSVAEVVYPPVQLSAQPTTTNSTPMHSAPNLGNLPKNYYLIVSRLVAYKRLDLAIQACLQLKRSLVIIGDGPDKKRLQRLAGRNQLITFLGSLSDTAVSTWIQGSQAVLMPGLEDFGITACEAVAQGKPVVLHQASGAAELIADQQHGIYLKSETTSAMIEALKKLDQHEFKSSQLQQSMQKYATTSFVKKWQLMVADLWQVFQQKGFYER